MDKPAHWSLIFGKQGVPRNHTSASARLQARGIGREHRQAGNAPRHIAPRLCHPPLQAGYDIRTVQDLLGQADVATSMIYTHVLKAGGGAVRGPMDSMMTMSRL